MPVEPKPAATAAEYIATDPVAHRADLIALNIEYMQWALAGMEAAFGTPPLAVLGQPVADYVADTVASVCGAPPPHGVFYLVRRGGEWAGMGGLRRVRDGVAELKRVYVRPAFRGARLGAALVDRLLQDARRFGYRQAWLDSAPFMTSAHRLYEAAGFADCAPYPETEVPPALRERWRFMAKVL